MAKIQPKCARGADMKIALVRGKFLNQFEIQSFEPLCENHELVGFSSLRPIHKNFPFPIIKLSSPVDLPNIPNQRIKMAILNRIFMDAHYLSGLEEKLKGFDIAHTSETYYHYTQQCLNAKRKGYIKKVVATVWENIPFNNEGIRGRKNFKKRALSEVDHFLAVTEGAKEALIREGCNQNKITIIPMGINIDEFVRHELRSKSHEESGLEILFVGRLEAEKGIMELLDAFKLLTRQHKNLNLKLRIIGKGSLRNYIVRRRKEWGISGKIIIEEKSYNEMPNVYQKADIFVLPSKPTRFWSEQFGMVLIEAMASGLPVITTRSGSIPEVVDEAGILVKPGDSKSLYAGFTSLLESPALRKKLSKAGRERVIKNFDRQKVAKKIENIYQQCLLK